VEKYRNFWPSGKAPGPMLNEEPIILDGSFSILLNLDPPDGEVSTYLSLFSPSHLPDAL
jgi:hypothetical protein